MVDFGCTDITIAKMFDSSAGGGRATCWMDLCHADFKLQMHAGDKLKTLQKTFLGNIDRSLHWDRISGPMVVSDYSSRDCKTVSLWKWCGEVVVDSATSALFGQAIYKVAPDIVADFFPFDEVAYMMPYRLPEFAARTMYEYKRGGEVAFARYLTLPKEDRQDASCVVQRIEEGMQDLGITDPTQCGTILFTLHRLVNTNAYRLCFWALAYLLHDDALLATIHAEITPAFNAAHDKLDMNYLLDQWPQLGSLYEELLRTVNHPPSARALLLLRSSSAARSSSLDESCSCRTSNCTPIRKSLAPTHEFGPARFLKRPDLLRSTSWRPFGGAKTHCPGRFLARREVYMFLALFLFRFNIKLVPKPKFPVLDTAIPAGGVLPPIAGDDVFVQVRPLNG
ncbi:cholesterol 7-alpha-monooxygenase [Podospora australis]|uniref:Cholesterol 7-alpha-monooxygenase n=1 Tax=Podospora australis TaxID=1536484 RepID=A0AAN6WI32_9PEZI|nr:cholesterol 7-alpha-monooxygenase [Podospora australis]